MYVLHFDRPTLAPDVVRQDGDALHYIGQAAGLYDRLDEHRRAWDGRGQRDGARRLVQAGLDGVAYRLAGFIDEHDAHARLLIEAQWREDPPAHCAVCSMPPVLRTRLAALQRLPSGALDLRGPGVFVLHFDQPIRDLTLDPDTYGDARHYVAENARNVAAAIRTYTRLWADPSITTGPQYIRSAGQQRAPFHVVHVQAADDPVARRALRTAMRASPSSWCPTCGGVAQ